jgi:hypothetical protein
VRGEVHDENAFALGGGAARRIVLDRRRSRPLRQMLVWRGVYDQHRIVSRSTVEAFTRRAAIVPGSSRALGWDTKSPSGSSAGTSFSADSFGHTGFTGTSIWIDPDRELFVVLLTNRVHPTRDNNLVREARSAVADAVVRALLAPGETPGRRHAAVAAGLDRIATGEVSSLAGKRVGLIAHAASVTRGTLSTRCARSVTWRLLPSTACGQAAAGERGERRGGQRLAVLSLYGDHAPAADLAGSSPWSSTSGRRRRFHLPARRSWHRSRGERASNSSFSTAPPGGARSPARSPRRAPSRQSLDDGAGA